MVSIKKNTIVRCIVRWKQKENSRRMSECCQRRREMMKKDLRRKNIIYIYTSNLITCLLFAPPFATRLDTQTRWSAGLFLLLLLLSFTFQIGWSRGKAPQRIAPAISRWNEGRLGKTVGTRHWTHSSDRARQLSLSLSLFSPYGLLPCSFSFDSLPFFFFLLFFLPT